MQLVLVAKNPSKTPKIHQKLPHFFKISLKITSFFKKIPPPAAPVTSDHILNTIYQRLNEGLQTALLSANITLFSNLC